MKQKSIFVLAIIFGALAIGCNTVPISHKKPSEPTQLRPIDFSEVRRPANIDRGNISTQDAVAYTNWAWLESGDRTLYQLSARTLAASLRSHEYSSTEEQMRLSVMTLQSGLIAGDNSAMETGIQHWKEAYENLDRISFPGEIETYLAACRIAGARPDSAVQARANAIFSQTLK